MQAAATKKFSSYNLADMIQFQKDAIAKRDGSLLGRILNIRMGIDDQAEYFQGEAWRRVARSTKVMGLTLEWEQKEAPVALHAQDRQTLLLPSGIQNLPTMAATVLKDIRAEVSNGKDSSRLPVMRGEQLDRMPQRLSDFASGRIMGRGGAGFLVIQPIEQVVILAYGISTMLILKGHPVEGRYPALLVSPKSSEAYIVGGMLAFD